MKKMSIFAGLISRIAMVIGWIVVVVMAAVSTWNEISKYGIADEDALLLVALTIGAFGMMGEKIEKLGKFTRKHFKIKGGKVKELQTKEEMVA